MQIYSIFLRRRKMPPEVNVNQNYSYNPYVMDYLKKPISIDNQQSTETPALPVGMDINVFSEDNSKGYNIGFGKKSTNKKNTTIDFSSNYSYSESINSPDITQNLVLNTGIKKENPNSTFFANLNSAFDKSNNYSSVTNTLSAGAGFDFGKKIDQNLNAQFNTSASFVNSNNSGEVYNMYSCTGKLNMDYTLNKDKNIIVDGYVGATQYETSATTNYGAGVSMKGIRLGYDENNNSGYKNSTFTLSGTYRL